MWVHLTTGGCALLNEVTVFYTGSEQPDLEVTEPRHDQMDGIVVTTSAAPAWFTATSSASS